MRNSLTLILSDMISRGASKLNAETGCPARPTRIVEKLTVKLDAQRLMISIPVTPFGMVRGEWSVGKCRIIDLDSIVPMQPETI